MSSAEEHRTRAIDAVCIALASTHRGAAGASRISLAHAASAYRDLATEIVDHVTAHAVETVRDLERAERAQAGATL